MAGFVVDSSYRREEAGRARTGFVPSSSLAGSRGLNAFRRYRCWFEGFRFVSDGRIWSRGRIISRRCDMQVVPGRKDTGVMQRLRCDPPQRKVTAVKAAILVVMVNLGGVHTLQPLRYIRTATWVFLC